MTPDAQFAAFARRGELRFQRCEDCGTRRWPPESVCHACLSPRAAWDPAQPTAKVLSYTVLEEALLPSGELPLVIVHVQFDDGVRYTAPLRGPIPEVVTDRSVRWELGASDDHPVVRFVIA
jgi:uncharacterized protein